MEKSGYRWIVGFFITRVSLARTAGFTFIYLFLGGELI